MPDKTRRIAIHLPLAAALCLALVTPVAQAEDQTRLSAEEITALLSGRTAIGTWDGRPYRQYFAASGLTQYKPLGRPVDEGRWRVNEETGDYESWWEQTGWTAYGIEASGYGHVWVDSDGNTHPFEMRDGNRLDN